MIVADEDAVVAGNAVATGEAAAALLTFRQARLLFRILSFLKLRLLLRPTAHRQNLNRLRYRRANPSRLRRRKARKLQNNGYSKGQAKSIARQDQLLCLACSIFNPGNHIDRERHVVMSNVTPAAIKALREKTGAGMMECKKALTEAEGNEEKAIENLRKHGLATATKKAGRVAAEGLVNAYIHAGGKIGVLLEVNCETDFVARGEEFRAFVHNLAMHITAAEPRFTNKEDVPPEVLDKEREIALEQARLDPKNSGKPQQVLDKIVEGRIGKFYQETCLMEQAFVKDQNITVGDLVGQMISKTGENIRVRRFTRYKMGEGLEKRASDLGAEVQDLLGGNK